MDSGADADVESGPPDGGTSDAGDAATDAGPEGCETWVPDGDRACVPAGELRFGIVVDETRCPACPEEFLRQRAEEASASPYGDLVHRARTESFLIDLREVSIAEYADYLASSDAAPPPTACEHVHFRYLGCPEVSTSTGWDEAGAPIAEWLELPVTCVTKQEAESFCDWRGGFLPDTLQWMKAARGPAPNQREYPWAEEVLASWAPGANLDARMVEHVAEPPQQLDDACEHIQELRRPAATSSHVESASPYGLLNVVGNAAEWVRTAESDDGYERLLIDVVSGPFTSESPFGHGEGALAWVDLQISTGMNAQN